MVSGEDCSCTDATESSNITSLQSDPIYSTNANVKEPLYDTATREHNTFQQFNLKDCKCREIHHGATSEQCAVITGTIQESYKKDSPKDKCSKEQSSKPCLCHAHKIRAYTLPLKCRTDRSGLFSCPFKWRWQRKERKDKTYEVKLTPKKCPHYAEPFMCCEISEGIPSKKKTPPKPEERKVEVTEKIDIYYFDHGNSAYYRTTDSPPILATEKCAEKTDQAATRFWAEIFGTIHIGTAFITAFVLQLVRFILYSIIRPLTVGILQLLADYFIKPLLSIVFNALIQPVLILLYNIATSCKDLCEPIAEAIGLFLREIAHVCAAIRVVEVKQGTAPSVACT
ncbi:hypothetical protein QLX08_003704 [Tetragonisca angustula]|uniref:Uncharacterized protein n=1 Tax=Tetragonisca angustula TaxID=166442 RepID=A0AAW1A851_9HYME